MPSSFSLVPGWIAYTYIALTACLKPRPIYEVCVKWLVNDWTNYYFPLCDQHFVHLFAQLLLSSFFSVVFSCLLSPQSQISISDRNIYTLQVNAKCPLIYISKSFTSRSIETFFFSRINAFSQHNEIHIHTHT